MADNYLEKRMEDLRSGRLRPSVTHGSAKRELRGQCFFVPDGTSPRGREMVESLRRRGATVAFGGLDAAVGQQTASVYGATYLSSDPDDEALREEILSSLQSRGNFVILKEKTE